MHLRVMLSNILVNQLNQLFLFQDFSAQAQGLK